MGAVDGTAAEPRVKPKSPGLAFILGLFLGGIALWYVRPLSKALLPALLTYALVAASGGTLWLPTFLFVGLWAAREAKFSEGRLAFDHLALNSAEAQSWHQTAQTAPLPYLTVQVRKPSHTGGRR